MKTSKIILTGLLLAVSLPACKKDDDVATGGTKSYLTVHFSISDPQTRTHAADSRLDGTPAESSISQAVVYLVQDGTVKAVLPVSTLNRISSGGYDSAYESSVIETSVDPGTYTVFAYAGSNVDPFGYSPGDAWKQAGTETFSVISLKGVANAATTAAQANSFRMFSQYDEDINDTRDNLPKVTITSGNNTPSNPAAAEAVKLDRLTAKVTAGVDPSMTVNPNIKSGDFANAVAVLDGMLPLQAALTSYIRQTWADDDCRELVSPATSRYGHINGSFTDDGSEYVQISTSTDGGYASVVTADLSGRIIAAGDPLYVLENAAEASPVWGSTTGVVFKVTLDVVGGAGSPETFFGYNNNTSHFLTLEDLQAGYPDAFDVFGNTLPGGGDDDAANLADAKSLLARDVGAFRARTGVNVFENGAMYYSYFIKDNSYDTYGVFRNTWYQLVISEITNFGSDVPGGWNPDDPGSNPDPATPVEDEKLYIKVKLMVNKWVANVTTINLGD